VMSLVSGVSQLLFRGMLECTVIRTASATRQIWLRAIAMYMARQSVATFPGSCLPNHESLGMRLDTA